ncbi:MAG: 30S ribosomal protein S20 [Planctomycetota bacterium]
MPQSLSARKRVRQNEKRRLRNKAVRSSVRSAVKSFRKLVDAGDLEAARTRYDIVQKKLDQAVSKGVFHRNTASRYKSRLAAVLRRSTPAATG